MDANGFAFQDFELDIAPAAVRLLRARAGTLTRAGAVGNPAFNLPADFDLPLLESLVEQTIGQAEARSDPTFKRDELTAALQREALALGQRLFHALFPANSALAHKYTGSVHEARGANAAEIVGLRLRLRLEPHLAHLPWEVLAATAGLPEEDRFLALRLSVTRLPPTTAGPAPAYPAAWPLRLLLVADDPFVEEAARLEAQKQIILDALAPFGDRIAVDVLALQPDETSTLQAIGRCLETRHYQILHFMGHGFYDLEQEEPIGYLNMTRDGEAHSFADREVAEVLRRGVGRDRGLRLVVFNACETARGRPQYTGVAQAALDVGVPAVVAMQYLLSDPAARVFARSFYRRLADTLSVDEAVRFGRQEIDLAIPGSLEWLTPTLFFTAEGPLFLPPAETTRLRAAQMTLDAEAAAARNAYLTLLRLSTRVLPKEEYLAVQVTRSTTVVHQPSAGGAPVRTELQVHSATAMQGAPADALASLFDEPARQVTRPVHVVLGETGSGKTTVLSQGIGLLVPDDPAAVVRLAAEPDALIPIRVRATDLPLGSPATDLALVVLQAMSRLWAQPEAAAVLGDDLPPLPGLPDMQAWLQSPAWRFLFIVEDLEDVVPGERRPAGRYLRQLLQEHGRHAFIFTCSQGAFVDFVPYLGQNPQWEIAPLAELTVRRALRQAGCAEPAEEILSLLRQPWALVTYLKLQRQGEVILHPADLLRGQVEQLLRKVPNVDTYRLDQRLLRSLMQVALLFERRAQTMRVTPHVDMDELFTILAEVRGRRTYDLEQLVAGLLDAGILAAADGAEEAIRFASPHLQAILAALAMDRELSAAYLAEWNLTSPQMRSTLILLAQLRPGNEKLVVQALLARLNQPEFEARWEQRLELLDLAVHCLQHQPDLLDEQARPAVIRELGRMLLMPADEPRLNHPGRAEYLRGAHLNLERLPRTTMRIRAVRLLGYLRDPRTFELLRWLITDRVWAEGNRFARSGVRRAAALALYQLWRDGHLRERYARIEEHIQLARALLTTWEAYREGDNKQMGAAFGRLVSWLEEEGEGWIGSMAAVAIAEIAGQAQSHPLRQAAVARLAQAFKSAPSDTRWSIADGAAALSFLPADDVRPLAEAFAQVASRRGRKRFVYRASRRETAVYALGKLRQPEALPLLRQVLLDPDQPEPVVARAARALSECALESASAEEVERVRRDLTQVVESFRIPEAWEPWPRVEAVGSLGYLGDERAARVLAGVAADETHPDVRQRAVSALIQVLGREQAAELIQTLLPAELSAASLGPLRRLLLALVEIDPDLATAAMAEQAPRWAVSALEQRVADPAVALLLVALVVHQRGAGRPLVDQLLVHLQGYR